MRILGWNLGQELLDGVIIRPDQFQPRRPDRPDWLVVRVHRDRVLARCRNRDLRDDAAVSDLSDALGQVLFAGPPVVELDLRPVRWADTKLLAALVHALRMAAGRGVRLVIRPSGPMRPLIDICRLQEVVAGPPSAFARPHDLQGPGPARGRGAGVASGEQRNRR